MSHVEMKTVMSPAEFDAYAQAMARSLIRREASRSGTNAPTALGRVARKIGVPAGRFSNVLRGRIKDVSISTFSRIRDGFIAETQSEIMRMQHELEVARQVGRDPRSVQIAEIEDVLSRLRALVSEALK